MISVVWLPPVVSLVWVAIITVWVLWIRAMLRGNPYAFAVDDGHPVEAIIGGADGGPG